MIILYFTQVILDSKLFYDPYFQDRFKSLKIALFHNALWG